MITQPLLAYVILAALAVPAPSLADKTDRPIIGCGEQCIKLLCEFYEKRVPEDRIKQLIRPNKFGEVTCRNLARCLSKIGLGCYPFKGTERDLARVRDPVILHFRKDSKDKVGHFLVSLFDTEKNTLVGFDPALSGTPFELTEQKLHKFWTGVGLVVSPKRVNRNFWHLYVIITGSTVLGSFLALATERRRGLKGTVR